MPSPLNLTNLPAPRVPIIDERTGLISREWYRFFLNLFTLVGDGTNATTLEDLQVGPPSATIDELAININNKTNGFTSAPSNEPLLSQIAEIQKQINALQCQPIPDAPVVTSVATVAPSPVTKTADFTVSDGELWIINNKVGSTCTVTLPTASSYTGRVLTFQNYQDEFLVSASSNVVPLAGGAAGTAILDEVAGNWATLVSDGTNWIMMQETPNNVMLV